ncbi:MAG: hypothetical protein V4553_06460 [Bacteroidota bacterium]
MKKSGALLKLVILCLMFLHSNSYAQVLNNIQSSFKQYHNQVLQEKIYVHTDKEFYLCGELLWFKIYNVDAGTIKPVNISKIAYVDVLDDANNTILQAKIELKNGAGNGSFFIPVTVKNGNYKLRAYTNWMKNFGPEVFFEKTITIVNALAEPAPIAKASPKAYDIRFFAEGGNLIGGVPTTVGFKATGTGGNSVDLGGVVIDQHNDTVARFQSLRFGMGSFLLTPKANSTYKAVVRVDNNNTLIKELPPVAGSGYAIHLVDNNNGPEVILSTRSQGNLPLHFFVHSGHKVILAQTLMPDANGNARVAIDKAKLGEGINHLTLFNNSGQPVSERLYFKRPTPLNLRITALAGYKVRSEVPMGIAATDNSGTAQQANLSVAVYKLDSLNNIDSENIAEYLWLRPEINGNIESPDYYFDNVTVEKDKALDNLLLTQGWSRYKWDNVLAAKPLSKFDYLPEYNGHLITGQLTSKTGASALDIMGYASVIGKKQFYGAAADSTGRLLFNTKDFYGPGELVLQTKEQDSTYNLSLINAFSEKFTTEKLPAFRLTTQQQSALINNSISMQVQNIYSGTKLRQYFKPAIDTNLFYGTHYKTYMLDAYTRFNTIEEDLREYIAEVNVVKRDGHFHVKVIGPNGFFQEGDPLMLLDGVPIFNMDKAFTVDPLKIKKLEMVNQVYFWGPVFADGMISLTSYKGDMGGFEIDPHAVILDYEGMQLQREFYSPVYDTPQQKKSRLPDFRSVLYWAPDVNTDLKGNAKVLFYTSDKAGKYVAVFQGLTDTGKAGSFYFKFDVNN